jgi:hypothetical protein
MILKSIINDGKRHLLVDVSGEYYLRGTRNSVVAVSVCSSLTEQFECDPGRVRVASRCGAMQ